MIERENEKWMAYFPVATVDVPEKSQAKGSMPRQ